MDLDTKGSVRSNVMESRVEDSMLFVGFEDGEATNKGMQAASKSCKGRKQMLLGSSQKKPALLTP